MNKITKPALSKKPLWVAMVVASVVFSQSALAGGGGLSAAAGATEFTQLINKGELLTTANNTLITAEQSLRSALTLERQLKSLPAALINQLTGGSLQQIQQMVVLHGQIKRSMTAFSNADQAMKTFQAGVYRSGLTPSQYLQGQAQLAADRGGLYRENYQRNMEVMESLKVQQDELAQTMASIPTNALETVSGLQQVATINAQTQAINLQMLEQMRAANQIAIQRAQTEETSKEAGFQNAVIKNQMIQADRDRANANALADGVLPDPTRYSLTGN